VVTPRRLLKQELFLYVIFNYSHSEIKWRVIPKLLELGKDDFRFNRDSLRGRGIFPTRGWGYVFTLLSSNHLHSTAPHSIQRGASMPCIHTFILCGGIQSNSMKTEYISLTIHHTNMASTSDRTNFIQIRVG